MKLDAKARGTLAWRVARPFCQLHSSNAGTGGAGMDAKLLTKLFATGVVLMLGRVSAAEA